MDFVKPNEFVEETNPTENSVEFYSQKNGVSRRMTPSETAKVVSLRIGGTVSTVPGASGNPTNIRNRIVTDPDGNLWLIDAHGLGVQLTNGSSSGTSFNYQKIVGVVGSTFSISIPIPSSDRDAKIDLHREGVKLRYNDDFTAATGQISLVIPASGETFELKTWT